MFAFLIIKSLYIPQHFRVTSVLFISIYFPEENKGVYCLPLWYFWQRSPRLWRASGRGWCVWSEPCRNKVPGNMKLQSHREPCLQRERKTRRILIHNWDPNELPFKRETPDSKRHHVRTLYFNFWVSSFWFFLFFLLLALYLFLLSSEEG